MSIYKALKDLYSELATQQEQSKNYKKAIELLNKLLEVLETAKTILNKITEKNKAGFNEKEIEDMKTEAYLKIANIYYVIKDYDNTIATLDHVPNIKAEDYSALTVSYIYNI
jgi:tetratricopeptide (TPR) repeat protein